MAQLSRLGIIISSFSFEGSTRSRIGLDSLSLKCILRKIRLGTKDSASPLGLLALDGKNSARGT